MTMAAPSASVDPPANAVTIRDASKLPYVFATQDQILPTKNINDATTKTGRFPRYRAIGTQKKFWGEMRKQDYHLGSGRLPERTTYTESKCQDTIGKKSCNLRDGLAKFFAQEDKCLRKSSNGPAAHESEEIDKDEGYKLLPSRPDQGIIGVI